MQLSDFLSLSLLLLLPIIGAIAIAASRPRHQTRIRVFAIMISSVTLLYAAGFWYFFDNNSSALQFTENHVWSSELGMSFKLGIDGFSYPMLLLASFLSWIAILASKPIQRDEKNYYMLMLFLEAAMLGVFSAQDWSLFYIFWEATLLPLFFLIDRWGGRERQVASLNFVLYTMGGSVFMLISLLVAFDAAGVHSFSFDAIAEGVAKLDEQHQVLIFLGLLIGFGVKMPLFPLHGWLPLAHVQAPGPVSILLSGILLKMGAYGLIRSLDMLPKAAEALQTLLFVLALIAILYGGLLAWRQSDLKRMIAYSSVSHMGVVLLGLATLSEIGIMGAGLQMVAHGLIAGSLFMLISLLYSRTGLRNVTDYGALPQLAPRFAFFLMIALLAGVGLPGKAGFIAELHVIIGGFDQWSWWMLLLGIGVLISATYSLHTTKHLLTGARRQHLTKIRDLQRTELIAATALTIGIIFYGLYPAPLIDLMSASVSQMSAHFSSPAVVSSLAE